MPLPEELVVEALPEGAHLLPDFVLVRREAHAPLVQRLRVRDADRERLAVELQRRLALGACVLDLPEAHEVRAGEDALADEVGSLPVRLVPPVRHGDRLDGRQAAGLQALIDGREVAGQELVADGLDHLDAHNLREEAGPEAGGGVAVVAEDDLDDVADAGLDDARLCQLELLLRDGDCRPALELWAALRRADGRAAPAAADLQSLVARLDSKGVRDEVQLVELRAPHRVVGARVDGAGVHHRLAEGRLEPVVALVVRLREVAGILVGVVEPRAAQPRPQVAVHLDLPEDRRVDAALQDVDEVALVVVDVVLEGLAQRRLARVVALLRGELVGLPENQPAEAREGDDRRQGHPEAQGLPHHGREHDEHSDHEGRPLRDEDHYLEDRQDHLDRHGGELGRPRRPLTRQVPLPVAP
mmetsp:Transcript_14916/g.39634  ORF Transcript_14916/g.39634 Transcript_14916/m.39634 type:complete len:414 (-) Transcript_14916:4-1245(-)